MRDFYLFSRECSGVLVWKIKKRLLTKLPYFSKYLFLLRSRCRQKYVENIPKLEDFITLKFVDLDYLAPSIKLLVSAKNPYANLQILLNSYAYLLGYPEWWIVAVFNIQNITIMHWYVNNFTYSISASRGWRAPFSSLAKGITVKLMTWFRA